VTVELQALPAAAMTTLCVIDELVMRSATVILSP
jgi:hypothetical protein